MDRLPGYFRDSYLDAHNDAHRLSGAPVDFAHLVDASAKPTEPLSIEGVVLHCRSPKLLSDAVGHVCASIVPAALDELLRRDDADRDSYFLDPFTLFVVGARRTEMEELLAPFVELLRLALLDHFEEIGEESGLPAAELAAALAGEVNELVEDCDPVLELVEVRFRFGMRPQPRGERLLHYLFDARPPPLEPGPWPAEIDL